MRILFVHTPDGVPILARLQILSRPPRRALGAGLPAARTALRCARRQLPGAPRTLRQPPRPTPGGGDHLSGREATNYRPSPTPAQPAAGYSPRPGGRTSAEGAYSEALAVGSGA
jgi:hypothetical protein